MEAGESRTPELITGSTSHNIQNNPFLSTSNDQEPNLEQIGATANPESDPALLVPQLLDQLIALGQTAQQIQQVLGSNGYQPEAVEKVREETADG